MGPFLFYPGTFFTITYQTYFLFLFLPSIEPLLKHRKAGALTTKCFSVFQSVFIYY